MRKKREIFEQGSGSCRDVAKEFIEYETHNWVIIHCLCHTQKQGKIKFELAIKLHRDIFLLRYVGKMESALLLLF